MLIVVLLHIPIIQGYIGNKTADALGEKLGTKVYIDNVDLGFFNRIIIDGILVYDQSGKKMLSIGRASASADLLSLLRGQISITSAQFFGLKAVTYKDITNNRMNFQFVIDSLSSRNSDKKTPLDLRISSLVIRHGMVSYDDDSFKRTYGRFNEHHIFVDNIKTHVILNHLTNNYVNINVKKLSFKEQSGLDIKSLNFKLSAGRNKALLEDFNLATTNSNITIARAKAAYSFKGKNIEMSSFRYSLLCDKAKITPSDFSCFLPILHVFNAPFTFSVDISGNKGKLGFNKVELHDGNDINIQSSGNFFKQKGYSPEWNVIIKHASVSKTGYEKISKLLRGLNISLPQQINNLGELNISGFARKDRNKLAAHVKANTEAGAVVADLEKKSNDFVLKAETKNFDLGHVFALKDMGQLSAKISADGNINNSSENPFHINSLHALADIQNFFYNNHTYKNIHADIKQAENGLINGEANINDQLLNASITGSYNWLNKHNELALSIKHLNPHKVMGLQTRDHSFMLSDIDINVKNQSDESFLHVESPYLKANFSGRYDYMTLKNSVYGIFHEIFPSILSDSKINNRHLNNDIAFNVVVRNTEWLDKLFNIKLALADSAVISGNLSDRAGKMNLRGNISDFYYGDSHFKNCKLNAMVNNMELVSSVRFDKVNDASGVAQTFSVNGKGSDDMITSVFHYDNHSLSLPVKGDIISEITIDKNFIRNNNVSINILPSNVIVGDSTWQVEPGKIIYGKNNIVFDNFTIKHDKQYINVNGTANNNNNDSLFVNLRDVDVRYVLNLVNFHSVKFSGFASGQASVSSVFHDPQLCGHIDVNDFTFEDGEMGTLHADVNYDNALGHINIDAIADDGPGRQTVVKGYIAPKDDDILLTINADGTRMDFLEDFTDSFLSDIDGGLHGQVTLVGPLSKVNLRGDVLATGRLHLKPTNTDYKFENIHVSALPDIIHLDKDSVYDRNGNLAIIDGSLFHKHLTKLSYDIDIKANHLLCFDTHRPNDNSASFWGTVYATGKCKIQGKPGTTNIDIDATPDKNSQIVYNAASADMAGEQDFIHWHDVTGRYLKDETSYSMGDSLSVINKPALPPAQIDIPSDMHINFLINCNPDLSLKVLMDNTGNDNLTLNGNGVIRANYFNKGDFTMFGNYVIAGGNYKLTVQNIISRDFNFLPDGTIAFGGNAMNAKLNLTAKYTLNGVSLSDLKIGNSFSNNNIRVDCLMNIKGTPQQPVVDFSLDMPTVSSDAKQMIYSLINSEEEMNQQVLYLLTVGRFYTANNNAIAQQDQSQQQSQTSLMMQSLLSGTISQQLNNVLSNVINSNNWNIGANISTGNEGFNNAEYEGLLSGRMFNNRLLFNGQFGYRDNRNATTSFIGDFDLQYLLYPNGNMALRVYNQTNDRYFTRNSLNTQGIGLLMKKDFNGWRDFFKSANINKKRKKNKKAKSDREK